MYEYKQDSSVKIFIEFSQCYFIKIAQKVKTFNETKFVNNNFVFNAIEEK